MCLFLCHVHNIPVKTTPGAGIMLTSVKECGEAPAPNSMRYDNVSPTERIERGQNYPSHSYPQIGSQAQPWSLAVGPGPAPLGPDFVLRS